MPVSITTAALGGDIEVPTIDGGRSRVKIPEGSQSAARCACAPRACPRCVADHQGDMFIELAVETPVNLTPRQKELLREFSTSLSEDNNPESKSFLQIGQKLLGQHEEADPRHRA